MSGTKHESEHPDSNPDPITGQSGAHPVGTGVGAGTAGAVGTAIGGVVGGPVGAVVGAVVGSVVGGLVGKNVAESVNPTVEDEYWNTNYKSRDYVKPERKYEDYQPAYRTGYEGFGRHAETGKTYEEVEPELKADYERNHANTGLTWQEAQPAARDAYLRLYEERLVADKQRVKTGEVQIGKHVETETAQVSVPIEKERVVVERVKPTGAGTAVAPGTEAFNQNEVARVEVYEETPDVRKEAFVREEVKIRKEVDQQVVQAEEQLRREELDVNTEGRPVIDNQSGTTPKNL